VVRRPLHQRPLSALARRKLEAPAFRAKAGEKLEPAPDTVLPSFVEVMQRTGTLPLPPAPARVVPPKRSQPPPQPASSPSFQVREEDGWIEGYREQLPARARRKLNGPPGATLDLHGHDLASARRALIAFVERERGHGRERVLVIVGKGKHTAGGVGVLRSEIPAWLSQPPLSTHVLAFATAAPKLGGTGGVVVVLAPSSVRRR
jgi:DNA-nicking Smr family endonuclease